ncbi:MAG: acyltransferase [Deltaproteobacteria bacterium]|nr:acyltransferase [Deltaproteobacteria bacterium]
MGFWKLLRNAKNKLVFREYGKNVYIAPNVIIKRPQLVSIGNHVTVQRNASFYIHPSNKNSTSCILRLGNYVHIGLNNVISAVNSIIIEDYVLIAPNVTIVDSSHKYEDIEIPIIFQAYTRGGTVHIERECWIGTNVIILPNVTIGRHSIIGANSVVKQSIPPFSIAAGAPARVIRKYDVDKKKWVRV